MIDGGVGGKSSTTGAGGVADRASAGGDVLGRLAADGKPYELPLRAEGAKGAAGKRDAAPCAGQGLLAEAIKTLCCWWRPSDAGSAVEGKVEKAGLGVSPSSTAAVASGRPGSP
jgi:hypothetical protein